MPFDTLVSNGFSFDKKIKKSILKKNLNHKNMSLMGVIAAAYEGDLSLLPFGESGAKAQQKSNRAHKLITKIKETNRGRLAFLDLLYDLQSTPFCNDPGKNGRALFFLDANEKRVILDCVGNIPMQEDNHVFKVVSKLPRIPIEQTKQQECKGCSNKAFVLETYEQTEDHPCGDEWAKQKILLCPKCQKAWSLSPPVISAKRF